MAGSRSSPSQAQQAAKVNKNKKTANAANKSAAAAPRKSPGYQASKDPRLAGQGAVGFICLMLFILLCGMAFNPEGKILLLLRDFFQGLFGRGTFYLSIFGLMFLVINFLHKRPKKVGFVSRCIVTFVIMYGVFFHLLVNDTTMDQAGIAIVGDFYGQGITGESGGLICGFIGFFLRWALGKWMSILLVLAVMVLLFMGALDITIPGVIRVLRNLPPEDWGSTADEDAPEPSASERFARYLAGLHKHHQEKQTQTGDEQAEDDGYFDDEINQPEPVRRPNPVWERMAGFVRDRWNWIRSEEPEEDDLVEAEPAAIQPITERPPQPVPAAVPVPEPAIEPEPAPVEVPAAKVEQDPSVRKVTAEEAARSAQEVSEEIARAQAVQKPAYKFPPIDLLKLPARGASDGTAEMRKNSLRLNETLSSFKIDAHIINVTRGPSVTRYEVELDKGVRLNKLTTVADDIALSLGVSSVRIAPVPGKISVVGIEVPNQAVTNVNLREVIDSQVFRRSASKSTFAVGKDIGGSCIVGNIAKMPHMLIAGTTGSGKSVCMNSIIISLLYKASPEDVKLIMVDPKMVELGIYNDIPHLLIPVVTDPKKAAGSLQWAVTEMMRRYKLMSDAGVRDLESFNSIVEAEEDGQKLPQVVIIIDELADLMLVAAKEVEDSICRIAQMGRAAGMHLIIATQRPSADVITGLMKANIPSRIAFSVASAMESRIILDTQGAEKLVGKGDMLFAPIGTGKPQRVQGCFVSDTEVEAVATYVKDNFKASYDETVIDEIEKTAIQTGKKSASAPEPEANAEEMEHDDMLVPAVDVIMETQQASVSMLQRRLKLGYARAARIVDELEELGIVGPFQGSKPRSIQITKEQWDELKANGWPSAGKGNP